MKYKTINLNQLKPKKLKFFAKSNIQSSSGVLFKTIILMNADFLTIDAQSALRRCIELFSYNTRFFIIVENKNKLLNPILSRFCEIYVPEHIENSKVLNLHQYNLQQKMDFSYHEKEKQEWIKNNLYNPKDYKKLTHNDFAQLSTIFYENGISCLDLMKFIEASGWWNEENVTRHQMEFNKIKSEYRCEKLLIFYMLDFIFFR
jgi:hypothetical protein